jgi:hypothetical protein
VELNGPSAVTALQIGVSDREGTAALVEMPGHSGATYLRPGRGVAVTTIDRFCVGASLTRVDLIQIDAEGAQLRILRGGRDTLARFRPALLLELNTPTLNSENTSLAEVLSLLRSLEYGVYSMSPHVRFHSARDHCPPRS